MGADNLLYEFQVMGQMSGPVTAAQLRALARQGEIQHDTLVRQVNSTQWHSADAVPWIFAPEEAPPPPAEEPMRLADEIPFAGTGEPAPAAHPGRPAPARRRKGRKETVAEAGPLAETHAAAEFSAGTPEKSLFDRVARRMWNEDEPEPFWSSPIGILLIMITAAAVIWGWVVCACMRGLPMRRSRPCRPTAPQPCREEGRPRGSNRTGRPHRRLLSRRPRPWICFADGVRPSTTTRALPSS